MSSSSAVVLNSETLTLNDVGSEHVRVNGTAEETTVMKVTTQLEEEEVPTKREARLG